jgi:excisionase family DNA binding protein
MPLVLEGRVYYTTKEAADRLDVEHASVRGAVARGSLAVHRIEELRRNLIAEEELERYKDEVLGGKGWSTRKAPDYTPNVKRREYQRAWRERKRHQKGND